MPVFAASDALHKGKLELIAAIVICCAYIAWLLTLPVFPTQDGPMHLFYVHVLAGLLAHHEPYTRFYYIKHLLPPYSVYYYALLALQTCVPPFLADRIVICVYVVCFTFGFRYMARAVGSFADSATLMATPLLLNWPLGMGFVNFCLSLAIALWAFGLWLRSAGRNDVRRKAIFVLLACVMMLTHAVPLALLILFSSIVCLARTWSSQRKGLGTPFLLQDVVTLGVAALTLGYVKLFTAQSVLQQIHPVEGTFLSRSWHNLRNFIDEDGLSIFYGHVLSVRIYRVALLLLVLIAFGIAVRHWLGKYSFRHNVSGAGYLCAGIILWLVLPLIPGDFSHSHFFAERLLILCWLVPLLAASGAPAPSVQVRTCIIIAALFFNAGILLLADRYIRPMAQNVVIATQPSSYPAHQLGDIGLLLQDPETPAASLRNVLTWNPYTWAPAHYFRLTDTVMYNTPWMDQRYLPLGATPSLTGERFAPELLEGPKELGEMLAASPLEGRRVLNEVQFLVSIRTDAAPNLSARLLSAAGEQWPCVRLGSQWMEVCYKPKLRAPQSAN